jgi:hypothetical protein
MLLAGNDMEESGWKMVSGDVFRPPKNAVLLCVQIGSGVQIITSAFATLFFAALGKSLNKLLIYKKLHGSAACCLLVLWCCAMLFKMAADTICTSSTPLVPCTKARCWWGLQMDLTRGLPCQQRDVRA